MSTSTNKLMIRSLLTTYFQLRLSPLSKKMFSVVIRKHVVLTWNCHQQWFKIICCCWWLEWKLLHFKWYLSFIRHILTYCAGPNGIESQCWPAFGWPMILGQRQVYWSWIYFCNGMLLRAYRFEVNSMVFCDLIIW